jgi:hypothetical protein
MLKFLYKAAVTIVMACSITACADASFNAEGAIQSLTDDLLGSDFLNINSLIQQITNFAENSFGHLLSLITDVVNGLLHQLKSIINIFENNVTLST